MPNAFDDDTLMSRVQEGDLQVMGHLFERYHSAVYSFFVSSTRDRESSKDLTQDVFLRLLRYRKSYQPGNAFRPWLFRTARNVLFDFRRNTAGVQDHEIPEIATGPFDDLERSEERLRLERAMERLEGSDRELLIMSFVTDMSYPEIASVFEITVNAARVRVFRAVRKLRRHFPELASAES